MSKLFDNRPKHIIEAEMEQFNFCIKQFSRLNTVKSYIDIYIEDKDLGYKIRELIVNWKREDEQK